MHGKSDNSNKKQANKQIHLVLRQIKMRKEEEGTMQCKEKMIQIK